MLQLLCQSDSYNAININKQNMKRADTKWETRTAERIHTGS